jgi:hypothetical protein
MSEPWKPRPGKPLIVALFEELPAPGQGWTRADHAQWFAVLMGLLNFYGLGPLDQPTPQDGGSGDYSREWAWPALQKHDLALRAVLGDEANGLHTGEVIEALRIRLGNREAHIRRLERRPGFEEIERRLRAALGNTHADLSLLDLLEDVERLLPDLRATQVELERRLAAPTFDAYGSERRTAELKARIAELEHRFAAVQAERDACRRSLREVDERLGAGYNGLTLWLERLTAALGLTGGDYSMLELIGMVERRQMETDWPEEGA